MTKKLVIFLFALTCTSAMAGGVPAEWTARYKSIVKCYNAKDFSGLKRLLADSYVYVQKDGTKVNRSDCLKGMEPMFQAYAVHASEKIKTFTKRSEFVDVKFELSMTVTAVDKSKTSYYEVGIDTWQKIKGKWQIIQTKDWVYHEVKWR